MKHSDNQVSKLAISEVERHAEYVFSPKDLREVLVDNHRVNEAQASRVIEDLICTSKLTYSMRGKVGPGV